MDWFKFSRQYGHIQRARAERRMAKTGERTGEQRVPRRLRELSPGEQELASMIREHIQARGETGRRE